jgi:hypothetical protein
MNTIKIKSVSSLTAGIFLMIFLHYDVFGISRVDTIKNEGREAVAGIALDKMSRMKANPQISGTGAKHPGIVAMQEKKAISSFSARALKVIRKSANQKT